MEIEIINRECIKPSSATPNHLKTYRISLLDQLHPIEHIQTLLFFPSIKTKNTIHEIIKQLKKSLSATLTHYYPFAGTIVDDLYVDCNDKGVYYVEALVKNCSLEKFLQEPERHKLVPHDSTSHETSTEVTYILMIQVSIFECGGIAICFSISHKMADAVTSYSFLKAWAAIASDTKIIEPSFSAPSLFPQNTSLPRDVSLFRWPFLFNQGKYTTKRFVFSASSVRQLKKEIASSLVKSPTKVEVVSAIIWRSIMVASRTRNGSAKPSVISHPVNLRRRKLPKQVMGNLVWNATAECKAGDEMELHWLVNLIRGSFAKIDEQFFREIQGDEGFPKVQQHLKELEVEYGNESADYVSFTSTCNIGFNDVDFGWGKPLWVCSNLGSYPPGPVPFNLVVMFDTTSGEGVEAWVNLNELDMALVENHPDLLAFASISPCELNYSSFHPLL